MTGAVYDLKPNPCHVTLKTASSGESGKPLEVIHLKTEDSTQPKTGRDNSAEPEEDTVSTFAVFNNSKAPFSGVLEFSLYRQKDCILTKAVDYRSAPILPGKGKVVLLKTVGRMTDFEHKIK